MKIYYVITKPGRTGGIIAKEGDKLFLLNEIGMWEQLSDLTAKRYESKTMIDLDEYMKTIDGPQTVQLFQRTEPVIHPLILPQAMWILDGDYHTEPKTYDVDKSYMNEPTTILCKLPDGALLARTGSPLDKAFRSSRPRCFLKVIQPLHTQDGKYTLTDTNTKMIPKDLLEDAQIMLEQQLDEENQLS